MTAPITNGEAGSSVRTKLNTTIAKADTAETDIVDLQAADNRRAFAGGVAFDGVSGGMDAGDFPTLSASGLTFSVWINPTRRATEAIFSKRGTNFEYQIVTDALISGKITITFYDSGAAANNTRWIVDDLPPLDTWTHFAFSYADGTAAAYFNGESVTLTAEVTGTGFSDFGDTSELLTIGSRNNSSLFFQGQLRGANIFNRALSTTEAAELADIGIEAWLANYPKDKFGGEEGTLTSGTLTVGKQYRINTFVAGDDFTNVGAASNATGVEFVATGTTPTTWTNSSELEDIGAIAAYLMTEGIHRQLRDLSGRYDALMSATGYEHLRPKSEGYVRVKGADANPSIMMLEDSDIIPADAVWTQIIAEERIVDIANTAQDLLDRRVRLADSTGDLIIQRSDGTTHATLGTVTTPTDTDDVDVEVHYKQVIR